MTVTALQSSSAAHSSPIDRSRALGRLKFLDNGFRLLTFGAAVLVLVLLLGVVVSLFIGAWPAFRELASASCSRTPGARQRTNSAPPLRSTARLSRR